MAREQITCAACRGRGFFYLNGPYGRVRNHCMVCHGHGYHNIHIRGTPNNVDGYYKNKNVRPANPINVFLGGGVVTIILGILFLGSEMKALAIALILFGSLLTLFAIKDKQRQKR